MDGWMDGWMDRSRGGMRPWAGLSELWDCAAEMNHHSQTHHIFPIFSGRSSFQSQPPNTHLPHKQTMLTPQYSKLVTTEVCAASNAPIPTSHSALLACAHPIHALTSTAPVGSPHLARAHPIHALTSTAPVGAPHLACAHPIHALTSTAP
eukprot:353130-Chlamydomonas_euryale.AAC.1